MITLRVNDGERFVIMNIEGDETILSPEQAEQLAHNLTQAAQAARNHDASIQSE